MAAYSTIELLVNQKSTFQASFTVMDNNRNVIDLTGYTASAKFKRDYTAADNTAVSFTTTINSPANSGVVAISLTPEQTTALDVNTRYVYDVSITSAAGVKTRIVQGSIRVSGGVS